MDRRTKTSFLYLWVGATLVAGIGFIVFGPDVLATGGVVLIIIALVSLMPALRYSWWDETP